METFWKWIVPVFLFTSCRVLSTFSNRISCEYDAMTDYLHEVAAHYPHLAELQSIGKTEEDREIWVVIVSDSPRNRPLLRPQVKLVGNVNGMSGTACYVLLRLIKHLVEQYQHEGSLERKLLESVEIHVIANLNPDGYSRAVPGSCYSKEGRLNANGIDLNENFPDMFSDDVQPLQPLQAETQAMIHWMDRNRFTLSISLIGGAKVVVYPFDSHIIEEYDPVFGEEHLTPDDNVFKHLALTYVKESTLETWRCPRLNRHFPEGIINGASWQAKRGTMLDFNYIHGTMEIMVGVSCCRNSNDTATLEESWEEHRNSLLTTIGQAFYGVRGRIVDAYTKLAISRGKLEKREADYDEDDVPSYGIPWFTTPEGEFWRLWRPGNYKLKVEADGYKAAFVQVHVRGDRPTYITVELESLIPITHPPSFATTPTPTTEGTSTVHTITSTAAIVSVESTTEKGEFKEPVARETSVNRFSSLTQFDHSFINLLRGIEFGHNSQCKLSASFIVTVVVITMVNCLR